MTALAISYPPCEPRQATPRRPERRTQGHLVATIARALGTPLMPWQETVADVALELLPDGSFAYRTVIVTVPRQQGKTTLVLAVALCRAILSDEPQRVYYSAQTGQDGRQKVTDDWVPMLERSPLYKAIRQVRKGTDQVAVVFENGSRFDVMASAEHSGHGKTVDLAFIDEAFSDVDDRREQAMVPAQMTRRSAQLWVVSTAGTEASAYLRRKVDTGRAAVADGVDTGTCFFEWAADPSADPGDPATWWSCMPALGHTVTEGVVRDAYRAAGQKGEEGLFRRAFCNLWTVAEERVIPAAVWDAVCGEDVVVDRTGGVAFALDVAVDRTSASIVAVDRERRCELVEHREGTGWVVDRCAELVARYPGRLAADGRGPAASLLPDLEARGIVVVRYGASEVAAACARIYDDLADRRLRVRSTGALNHAVEGARRRIAGDAWYWARRDARTDISPLVALTLGYDLAVSDARTTQVDVWFSP